MALRASNMEALLYIKSANLTRDAALPSLGTAKDSLSDRKSLEIRARVNNWNHMKDM